MLCLKLPKQIKVLGEWVKNSDMIIEKMEN